MGEFVIEKHVEMPDGRRANAAKYPFAQMEIGDSFAAPIIDAHTAQRLRNAAGMWAKNHRNGFKFSVRAVVGGLRVWRVA